MSKFAVGACLGLLIVAAEAKAQGFKDHPGRPANRPVGADGFVKGNECVDVAATSVPGQEFLDCALPIGSRDNRNGQPFPCYITDERPAHNNCAPRGPRICLIDYNGPINTTRFEWRCDRTLKCNQDIALKTIILTEWVADGCQ